MEKTIGGADLGQMLRGLIVDLGTRATVEQAVEYTRVGFQAKVDLGYKCQGH